MLRGQPIHADTIPRAVRAWVLTTLMIALGLTTACSRSEQAPLTDESPIASAKKDAVTGGHEFEGTIVMSMNMADMKGMEMTFYVKGDRSRMETKTGDQPGMQGAMLWDTAAGKMTTLMPQQKMYMTMDLKSMAEGMEDSVEGEDEQGEKKFPKLTATGKQETIAGYSCEHWLIGDKQEIDICVAKGLGYFGMGGRMPGAGSLKDLVLNPKTLAAMATMPPEWVRLLEGGAFPLKITDSEDGKTTMTMEATRIERKSLDDSLFSIPSDYKEFKMPRIPGR